MSSGFAVGQFGIPSTGGLPSRIAMMTSDHLMRKRPHRMIFLSFLWPIFLWKNDIADFVQELNVLTGVLVENIRRGIIAELEVHFLFTRIGLCIEIFIQNAIPEAIGARAATVFGRRRSGELVDF